MFVIQEEDVEEGGVATRKKGDVMEEYDRRIKDEGDLWAERGCRGRSKQGLFWLWWLLAHLQPLMIVVLVATFTALGVYAELRRTGDADVALGHGILAGFVAGLLLCFFGWLAWWASHWRDPRHAHGLVAYYDYTHWTTVLFVVVLVGMLVGEFFALQAVYEACAREVALCDWREIVGL